MTDALRLCQTGDVEEGEPVPILIEGAPPLAVYEVEGAYFVTDSTCTHGQADLTDGFQDGATIECPFHGGAFDIATGAATAFPCERSLQIYSMRVEDGWIVIDRPSRPAPETF